MSAVDLGIIARLVAVERRRAVPLASHRQIAIEPDALVLCALALAGEDTTIHIVACGRVGKPAEFLSVPDPRRRDEQYELFEQLADLVETYFEDCRRKGTFPQIWVSSHAGVTHLDVLADRLRYNKQNVRVRRFGELLSYATERSPVDGQQALHSATAALRLHYATGQQEAEDEHLGVLLTWIDPPKGKNVLAAVAIEEQIPMGVKTAPEFDKDTLAKLVYGYDNAKRAGASSPELTRRRKSIHDALQPIVKRIYDATQSAIAILQTRFPQPLAALQNLRIRESEAFESFIAYLDSPTRVGLPLRDKPKAAAFKISEREHARETAEAALYAGDRVCMARAQLAGRILNGKVENARRVRLAPRTFESSFDVVSEQQVLRVRPRDEFYYLSDTRQKVVVRNVQRSGGLTRVSVVIVKGARNPGLPPNGVIVDFAPNIPEWDRLGRMRGQLAKRLATLPWTHSTDAVPPSVPNSGTRPTDLVAAVEALR